MNLAYIINKNTQIEKPLKNTDTPIVLDLNNKSYTTVKVSASDCKFFRFVINFNEYVSSIENIEVYATYKDAISFTAVASGCCLKIPFITATPIKDNAKTVLVNDGDIPIYGTDIYITITNRSEQELNLREISIMKIK